MLLGNESKRQILCTKDDEELKVHYPASPLRQTLFQYGPVELNKSCLRMDEEGIV